MAWNEPGGGDNGNKEKDPWNRKNNDQQPPDLDEMLRKFQEKLGGMFGGNSNNSSSGGSTAGFLTVVVLAAVVYVISGIYVVKPYEQAAVFQFGRYIATVNDGPHWVPRFIRSKEIVAVDTVHTSRHNAQMLTKDENIVNVELSVQYRISDLADYLFNVKNPEFTLEQVTDSAMRQVVGHSTLDEILTSGREQVRAQVREQVVALLGEYKSGLFVVDVLMQPAKAPEQVKEAFDDAIKAQEDEQRSINRAFAYSKKHLPIAEGQANRMVAEAEAYKENVVLRAEGDVARFVKVLPEYEKAPKVTRERLYLDTMSKVLSNSSKVVVDSRNSNNLVYLPIDKILAQAEAKQTREAANEALTKGLQATASNYTQQAQTRQRPARSNYRASRESYIR